jgi:hypothetical protein
VTRRGLLALVGLLALAGCGAAPTEAPPQRTRSYDSYVAIGDTFTAAPLTGGTRPAKGCRRATDNYPARVARDLGVKRFTDVSCTDARTNAGTESQSIDGRGLRPQADAVDEDTDLVTISLGVNHRGVDEGLHEKCATTAVPCALASVEIYVAASMVGVRDELGKTVRAVRDVAPQARILLVGYPRHVDGTRRCDALPPMSRDDVASWGRIDRALDVAVSRAARDTGVDFVDVRAASAGHGICSARPWVRGRTGGARIGDRSGIAFGPTRAGQRAIARLVLDTVHDAG